jgi:hypothetical protein
VGQGPGSQQIILSLDIREIDGEKRVETLLLVTKKKCKNIMIRARSVHKILSSVNTALCSFFCAAELKGLSYEIDF